MHGGTKRSGRAASADIHARSTSHRHRVSEVRRRRAQLHLATGDHLFQPNIEHLQACGNDLEYGVVDRLVIERGPNHAPMAVGNDLLPAPLPTRAAQALGRFSHQRGPKRPCRNATNAATLPGTSLGDGNTAWISCSGRLWSRSTSTTWPDASESAAT